MTTHNDFHRLCQIVGSNKPNWVQGAGGNVSQKLTRPNGHTVMLIKASGFRLDQVTESSGFVEIDYENGLQAISALLHSCPADQHGYSKALQSSLLAGEPPNAKPSMEAGFHLILSSEFVAHFHSLAAIMLCQKFFEDSEGVRNFLDGLSCTSYKFIAYTHPGIELAAAIEAAGPAKIYFLQNHGVILAMDAIEEMDAWQNLERRIIDHYQWNTLDSSPEAHEYFPLRFTVPDLFVFKDRILRILEAHPKTDDLYRLLDKNDPDATELWQANVHMIRAMKHIPAIHNDLCEALMSSPQERHRIERAHHQERSKS